MTKLASLLVVLTMLPVQQVRPDFSGEWVIAGAPTGLLGEKFIAVQDERTLSLRISVAALGRDVKATYNLDGSESRNFNPQGPGAEDEPIFSKVSWEGSRLLIHTRGSILVNGKPVESKRVIWIDAEGRFNIERSSDGQPTTRSLYRRGGQTGVYRRGGQTGVRPLWRFVD